MQIKMASVSSLTVFLLCCCASTAQGSSGDCDFYAATGTDFTVPLEEKLQQDSRLTWKLGGAVNHFRDIEKYVKTGVLTSNGSYILTNVKKEQSMVYTSEIHDKEGILKFIKQRRLCVLDPVSKPTVQMKCKESKVIITCVLGQNQPKEKNFRWIRDGQDIDYTRLTLEREASETQTNKFSCQVFNKVSSKTSDALSHQCPIDILPGLPAELFGFSIWIFVGCGGGIVLVLIIIVIICCICRKWKRSLHLKEEEELRLQWPSTEQQNHHHHLPPLPGNHPNHHQHHHEQKQAGHTGPRQSRSKQNRHHRPKAPEPSEGQPQPQPRRTAQVSRPAVTDDEDQPPPLPQPRKKGPKGPVV